MQPDVLRQAGPARPLVATHSAYVGLRARPWVGTAALFGSAYVAYLVVGAAIVFGAGSIPVDTWARVGNAFYALFSRDPHLGAIGFVLPPIPTLAILPIVPFKVLWPALVTSAFAAPITSAAFMAGALVLFRRILRDLEVRPWLARLLVALFALHPMILYYGANGLTEAPFVFFLLWATSALLRWLDRGRLGDLVRLAVALAVGYLTRYEFAAAVPAVLALVAIVAYLRSVGEPGARRLAALAEATIAVFPFAVAFVGWALTSWILVGSPFEAFTSIYGNSSQVRILKESLVNQTGQGTAAAIEYVTAQVLGLAPLLPLFGVLAIGRAVKRADWRVLAPLAVIGAPVAFSIVGFLMGMTVGFLRYEIGAIPLMFVLAATLLARKPSERPINLKIAAIAIPDRVGRVFTWVRLPKTPRVVAPALAAALVLATSLSLPVGLATMRHPLLAREEADALRSVLGNQPPVTDPSYVLATHTETARLAAAIDNLGLTRGSVLLDVATGNSIVLQSAHPDWFVITPDRDFERVVADPAAFGVKYLVVAGQSEESALDTVARTHPGLFENGAGFATLVGRFEEPGAGWRLYRVNATR